MLPDNGESAQVAIREAGRQYFSDCRQRVDGFVAAHFRYPGAWETNRPALGWDLLRAPVNLFWAPVYVLAMSLRWVARRAGLSGLAALLAHCPSGLRTRVQQNVAGLIYRELFRWGSEDDLTHRVALALDDLAELSRYGLTRTATADITNSLASAALGAFAFQKFTPGGIAMGLVLASWYARRQAEETFFLGDFLGAVFYSVFPVEPSWELQALGVGMVLACLAAFASFSGLITDPVQSVLGLHRYRLRRMIDSVEKDFERAASGSFNPKSPYLARVLELIDAARMV